MYYYLDTNGLNGLGSLACVMVDQGRTGTVLGLLKWFLSLWIACSRFYLDLFSRMDVSCWLLATLMFTQYVDASNMQYMCISAGGSVCKQRPLFMNMCKLPNETDFEPCVPCGWLFECDGIYVTMPSGVEV